MKKILVVMVVALCAVFSVNAIGPEFGVKAGVSFANGVFGENMEFTMFDNPLKVGITGGLMMEMPLGPVALGAELLYTPKGEKYVYGDDFSLSFNLDYIEVPVIAKITFLPLVKVYGGVSFGYMVNDTIKWEEGNESGEESFDEFTDGEVELNKMEMGVIMGVQVKISKLVFDARYNHGLTDIVKDNEGDAYQLRTLYATVGLTF